MTKLAFPGMGSKSSVKVFIYNNENTGTQSPLILYARRFDLNLSREFTVSIQFSRSMRSLQVDSYRASLVGILLASVILLALVVWFFTASITLYESTNSVSLMEDGRLMARFPNEAMARLRQGQPGVLRVSVGSDQSVIPLPIMVFTIQPGSSEVEIIVTGNEIPENVLTEGFKGQVQVEAEHITPATLVSRAMGKFLNRPQIPARSQDNQSEP
jgi:hypothetical protein